MILVTGATGTVGSAVVAALSGSDDRVRVATRDVAAVRDELADVDDYTRFDFTHPETWGPTLVDVDRLFLVRPPAVGVDRVREFVDAAARIGVEHVVYLSVLGAEKNPILPHRRIERHIESSGVAHTFLRASFFMQNLAEVHRRDIVEHDKIFVPAGTGKTSFVDARDVGAVAALALTEPGHDGRAHDLTGAEALAYADVADVFSGVLGRRITYADPSVVAFVRRLRSRGTPLPFVVVMLGIYTTARLGLAARVTRDVETLLDREPIAMRQFVAEHADAFRE
ncbi:SDR family oxidoreductase [Halococcus agarilyticus]|uniref:SDR family oxidoreductase n=1 Tax=Halococcus agarilyticus TaxID=1232219 RepID=UPI000677B278|nr:SDR family oxidoreductase [Halococcus agarilyticus]